jgi:hypothetical protein
MQKTADDLRQRRIRSRSRRRDVVADEGVDGRLECLQTGKAALKKFAGRVPAGREIGSGGEEWHRLRCRHRGSLVPRRCRKLRSYQQAGPYTGIAWVYVGWLAAVTANRPAARSTRRPCYALRMLTRWRAPAWPIRSRFAPDSPLEGTGFEPSVPGDAASRSGCSAPTARLQSGVVSRPAIRTRYSE